MRADATRSQGPPTPLENEEKGKRVELDNTLTTSSNSSEGEIGGLSVPVKEPPPFKGSLLWDNLPDVNGDTSCDTLNNNKTTSENRHQRYKQCIYSEQRRNFLKTFYGTSLVDCDIMRSRTSWEVAEEAKENWFLDMVEKSSERKALALVLLGRVSSGMEVLFELGMQEEEREEWWCERALETSRAEALHERDRNSMGTRGLSGRGVGANSERRQFMVHFGSICEVGSSVIVFLGSVEMFVEAVTAWRSACLYSIVTVTAMENGECLNGNEAHNDVSGNDKVNQGMVKVKMWSTFCRHH